MANKLTPENQGNFEAKEDDSMIKAALSSLKDIKIPPNLRASNQRSIRALQKRRELCFNAPLFRWRIYCKNDKRRKNGKSYCRNYVYFS